MEEPEVTPDAPKPTGTRGKRGIGIAQLSAFATALIAAATSIVSCQIKQQELEKEKTALEEFKKEKAAEGEARVVKARKSYLEALATSDRLAQARILRFVIATETDKPLCDWAKGELDRLEHQIDRETETKQAEVTALAEKAATGGRDAEDARLELALRSSELVRLQQARSTSGEPEPVKPAKKMSAAECFAWCSPPARKCEQECNGNMQCNKTRCYPVEAQCRQRCKAGETVATR